MPHPLVREPALPALFFPILLSLTGMVQAHDPQTEADEAVHSYGAHEHGTAHLNVAVEGADLLLELETPLMNLVGFEHAPRNDAQRRALAEAEAVLGDPARLFLPSPAAGCAPREAPQVELHPALPDAEEAHGDAHAVYQFTCQRPEALRELEVRLFAVFPGTERLHAQVAGPDGQRAQTLTAETNRLPL